MDPRNAKNFVPPSESMERARFMSASKIPDNGPIQKFMDDEARRLSQCDSPLVSDSDSERSHERFDDDCPKDCPNDGNSADSPANSGSNPSKDCPESDKTGANAHSDSNSHSHSSPTPTSHSRSAALAEEDLTGAGQSPRTKFGPATDYPWTGPASPTSSNSRPATRTTSRAASCTGSRSNSSSDSDSTDFFSNIPEGIPRPPSRARDFVVPEIHEPAYLNSAGLEEVPGNIPRQATRSADYQFPDHRLATQMRDPQKSPLVLVACGSFSPITYLHLRMFEMASDAVSDQTRFEVIGGYYSPVSDHYHKAGLAPAHHRVRMCELACERTSSWLMVDAWESLQTEYQRTATVLDHFNYEINVKRRGIASSTARGGRRGVKIMSLAGGDLIESMGEPNVWMDADSRHILGRYGCMIVERTGSDVRSFSSSHDIMYEHRHNVLVIKQLIYNDISSTKVRSFVRRNMSVQYSTPSSVIRYIYENKSYLESEPVKSVMSERGD